MEIDLPKTDVTAEIQFRTRSEADSFATAYSRMSLMGHSISTDNKVKIWNVTENHMAWIDSYINQLNNQG